MPLKLLKYINSAAFGWRTRIESIRHALVLLGEKEVRKWISVVALSDMTEDKTPELAVSSVVRARFCELLAVETSLKRSEFDLFLIGLFSLLDAILDCPLSVAIADLPLSADVIQALYGEPTSHRAVLDLVIAYECGDWDAITDMSACLGLNESCIPAHYIDAVQFATGTMK